MAGRPTDYTPELVAKAKEYLEAAKTNPDVFPSVADLSLFLDISRETVYAWCREEDKEEFSDTVLRINALQEKYLIERGLKGQYNASLAKLLLSSNHGHREKQDVTTNGKELPTPIARLDVSGDHSVSQDSAA